MKKISYYVIIIAISSFTFCCTKDDIKPLSKPTAQDFVGTWDLYMFRTVFVMDKKDTVRDDTLILKEPHTFILELYGKMSTILSKTPGTPYYTYECPWRINQKYIEFSCLYTREIINFTDEGFILYEENSYPLKGHLNSYHYYDYFRKVK